MTKLLEQAIAKVMQLPETEQDAIAAFILEELEDEARWDRAFSQSQDMLAKLAAEALAEDQAGKTQELDPEIL
jgi:predicted amidophosphoribosyltransferase